MLVLSCLDDVTTKVNCLDLGAHDYLTKPFSLEELLARVRVQLRSEPHQGGEVLRAGDLVLDVGRLQADIGAGPVALTRLEFLLLRELIEHAGPVGTQGSAAPRPSGVTISTLVPMSSTSASGGSGRSSVST